MATLTHRITVRLTDEEAETLSAVAESLGCSPSEAVRKCIKSSRPVVVSAGDADAVRECSRTIGRMGGLLNQVAHRLNERRSEIPDKAELDYVISLIETVASDLSAARSELAELRERQGARVRAAMPR